MRKLLMSVLAAFTLLSVGAQKMSQEEVRLNLAKGMANFVTAVKPFYVKEQDQQKFVAAVTKTWKPTKEGTAVLNKAFELIAKNSTADNIISSYNGKEMAAAVIYLKKVKDANAKSDGAELFGGVSNSTTAAREAGAPCRWFQLWCHLQNFANWVVDNWPVIDKIIRTIAEIF